MSNEPTYDDVLAALGGVRAREGQPAVRKILSSVGRATAASDLDEEDYAAVITACEGKAQGAVKTDGTLDSDAIMAKFNASGARQRARKDA